MAGLMRRPSVRDDPSLWNEAVKMQDLQRKVEIEEMHVFGFEYLAQLIQYKIVHHVYDSNYLITPGPFGEPSERIQSSIHGSELINSTQSPKDLIPSAPWLNRSC